MEQHLAMYVRSATFAIACLAALVACQAPAANSDVSDLEASAHSITFVASVGGADPATQSVAITNASGGSIAFSTTTNPPVPWLSCTADDGVTPATQVCRVVTGSLAAGTYSTTRTVRNNSNTADIEDVAVTFVVSASPPVTGVERRCSDLVADGNSTTQCFCSEILNYSQPRQTGVVDPPTSESFECAPQYGGSFIDSNAYFSSVSGAAVGLPSVAQVIQIEKDTGGLTDFFGPNLDLSSKTMCERVYFKYSPGHIPPPALEGGDNAFKGPRWMNDANGAVDSVDLHCSWAGGIVAPGPEFMWCVANGASGSNWEVIGAGAYIPLASGVHVVLDDCEASWCRFEACIDHNSRTGNDANKLHYRYRMTRIDTCKQGTYVRDLSQFGAPIAMSGNNTKLWMHADNTNNDPGTKEWVSHIMAATVTPSSPSSENFWIGAAAEVVEDKCP